MPGDSLGYAIARMENETVLRDDVEVIRAGYSISFTFDGEDYGHAIVTEADKDGFIPLSLREQMKAALVDAYNQWMEAHPV